MSDLPAMSFPVLHVRGSHYDVGFHTGSTFRERIKLFYQKSLLVQEQILPFCAHRRGREIAEIYLRGVQDRFPHLIREIQGMADGVGMPFEDIFHLNIAKEICNCHFGEMEGWPPESDDMGCSSIMINTPNVKLMAHNEDCDPHIQKCGYFVCAHVTEEAEEDFTAFSYPGSLPGNTFSFNKYGMIFSCDALYPKHAKQCAAPRFILNRAMMAATSVEHVRDIGRNAGNGSANGFSLNLGNWKQPKDMWALEIGPGEKESETYLHTFTEQPAESADCSYYHTNNYKHLHVEEVETLRTSLPRMKRMREFTAPTSLLDIKRILGDTQNDIYPIYRTPSATDKGKTVATAIFDLLEKKMDVYVDNLRHEAPPLLSLPLI